MSTTKRRTLLGALGALLLAAALPALADGSLSDIRQRGALKVAVYNDFAPYHNAGKGIDADLGRALAERMGLSAQIVGFKADDDMGDDLRNMVWKGHYLGTQPADVMMHVPVDAYLAKQNDKVHIFGPYHLETVAVVRDPAHVPVVAGSAATALEVFTREKIGVETASLPDAFLLGALNGRLRDNVKHYASVAQAVAALRAGEVSAVMATRSELEGALGGKLGNFVLEQVKMPELRSGSWSLGMAVKADAEDLQKALSEALVSLERDGTVAKIFAQNGVTLVRPGD